MGVMPPGKGAVITHRWSGGPQPIWVAVPPQIAKRPVVVYRAKRSIWCAATALRTTGWERMGATKRVLGEDLLSKKFKAQKVEAGVESNAL
jgi:hypothetical protein